MNRYFADISNNNTQHMNFDAYRKMGQHVLIGHKASEGTTFIDRLHAERSERSHKAGVWVIHYHYAHPSGSATAQARFFWSCIKEHFAAKDFACIDIEEYDGQTTRRIKEFVEEFKYEFERISGHSLIGYSSESFHNDIGDCGIKRWWNAAYGPHKPARSWAWQFTDGSVGPEPHSCAGIGKCDVSVLNWSTYLRLRITKPRV